MKPVIILTIILIGVISGVYFLLEAITEDKSRIVMVHCEGSESIQVKKAKITDYGTVKYIDMKGIVVEVVGRKCEVAHG